MRRVHRDPALSPAILRAAHILDNTRQLVARAADGEQVRSDAYDLVGQIRRDTRGALKEQFHGKCAYCEQRAGEGDVDWFRPAFGAERQDGQIAPHHYVWLIAEWDNLFLCCPDCNRNKRNRFPVAGEAGFDTSLFLLRQRREALLLDPCWDRPERHLRIDPHGRLVGITERGATTIDVLGLNRSDLRERRRDIVRQLCSLWNDGYYFGDGGSAGRFDELARLFDPAAEFVGTVYLFLHQQAPQKARQVLRKSFDAPLTRARLGYLQHSLGELDPEFVPHYATAAAAGQAGPSQFARFLPIAAVEIENFKGIDRMRIDVPSGGAACMAIVGENATGKSSVLQAIALCLVGAQAASRYVSDARGVLAGDAPSGRIVLRFHGSDAVNELTFDRRSPRFGGSTGQPTRVFGYGPYRLLAKRGLPPHKRGTDFRLASLFDDGAKLNGYHGWLKTLNEKQQHDLAEVLHLLLVARDTVVTVDTASLTISTNGRVHPIGALSSGMQSIVSMCCDIMDAVYALGDSVLGEGYVILIDEVDAHLHPAWRVGIERRLRRAFPNAQIIFSTHDPLALRGLESGQVHMLVRSEDGSVGMADVRYSDGQSIDQVLTSRLFGLHSTHSDEWEDTYDQYIDLLAREDDDALTQADRDRLASLEAQVGASDTLGDSRRKQLMNKVVDRFLALERQDAAADTDWDPATIDMLARQVRDSLDALERADD